MFVRKIALVSLAALALSLTACAGSDSADDSGPVGGAGALASGDSSVERKGGSIETFIGEDDQTYFRVLAANGLRLLRSEGYKNMADAEKAMTSLLTAAKEKNKGRFDIVESNAEAKNGKVPHFVNVVGAGASTEVIATSELYSSKDAAEKASNVMIGYLKGIASATHVPAEKLEGERFELFKIADDEASEPFKFLLRAKNGETVLMSELYSSKEKAEEGIEAVKCYGRLKANFEVSTTKTSKGVFELVGHTQSSGNTCTTKNAAGNHQAVGFSEVYASKSGAQTGADAVQKLLQADLRVTDLTK